VKRLTERLNRRLLPRSPEITVPAAFHGTEYGGWTVATDGLSADTRVYSLGIGEDISFDLALIARYGVDVHAFDPTPRSIAWVKAQALPPQFHLVEFGVAAVDGTARFFAPENPAYVSHTLRTDMPASAAFIDVPVRRMATLMQMLGHPHVDLLKMDIEGAEYEVIDDLLRSGIRPRQLLVEFHHRMIPRGAWRTWRCMQRLRRAGYRLFAISPGATEYAFLLTR
jgi:FkbM family methyltransferase